MIKPNVHVHIHFAIQYLLTPIHQLAVIHSIFSCPLNSLATILHCPASRGALIGSRVQEPSSAPGKVWPILVSFEQSTNHF